MAEELAGLLQARIEEVVAGAMGRLAGRPEFLYDRTVLAGEVRRCALALRRANYEDSPAPLAKAALLLGQADPRPARGYRKAQLVLEAICAETVEMLHSSLSRDAAREALVRLRRLLGPAQIGLAAVFRSPAAVEATAGSATS